MMQNMMVNVGGVMVLYCNTTIVYSFNNMHHYLGSSLLIDCFGDLYQHITDHYTEVCEIQHHPLVDEVNKA